MVKRKTPSASGDKEYTVGYCKPPVHTQFRPGQSGYPAGRRKGSRNLKTDVKRALAKPIKVKQGSRTRTLSTQEAGVMVLVEKALRGDSRALNGFFDLALRFNNDGGETDPAQPLSADDQAILAAFLAERATATPKPEKGFTPNTRAATARRGRNKTAPK